jgi:hypothetical protein
MKENVVQRVSAPIIKKPIRKTRAGKRTFVPPAFSIVSTSIALRKSTRNIVYSEKRVNVPALVPLFIHQHAFPMVLTCFFFFFFFCAS